MDSESSENAAPYPNALREHREAAHLTRRQLTALCGRLAEKDDVLHTAVSIPTIQKLERGLAQPRASTARTLAEALGSDVKTLFPAGIDTKNRRL